MSVPTTITGIVIAMVANSRLLRSHKPGEGMMPTKEQSREWYAANREVHLKRCRLRYQAKRHEILARNREAYQRNKEKNRARRRQLYAENKDAHLEYQYKWRQAKKLAEKEAGEQKRSKNLESQRRWRQNNPDYKRRHRAQKGDE